MRVIPIHVQRNRASCIAYNSISFPRRSILGFVDLCDSQMRVHDYSTARARLQVPSRHDYGRNDNAVDIRNNDMRHV